MTLIEFLKARLGEDEDKAKAAVDRKAGYVEGWAEFDGDAGDFLGPFGTFLPDKYTVSDCDTPERVLDEVEVKRHIIAEYADYVRGWEEEREAPDAVVALQLVLQHMAEIYANHPDYQQRWAL